MRRAPLQARPAVRVATRPGRPSSNARGNASIPPCATHGEAADAAYGWGAHAPPATSSTPPASHKGGGRLEYLPVSAIRRPLAKARANDPAKVEALAASMGEYGQREPIDVLECDGVFFGFSGCHRYEALSRKGPDTPILCRVRVVSAHTLRMHMR